MNAFYLHGFASSPQSSKAAFFRERFAGHGITLACPDFNEPDFTTLTITRMLDQLEKEIGTAGSAPVVLLGSSLGGVVAVLTAARLGVRIDRLILFAPALAFPRDAEKVLGVERVGHWRETGMLDVFHYARGATVPLDYAFYEDGLRYDGLTADVTQPTMIFQGLNDDAVDHRMVQEYARRRPHAELVLLDDDHQLSASLPRMWSAMSTFLGLT